MMYVVRHSRTKLATGSLTIAIVALLATLSLTIVSPAVAQDAERIRLGIKPVGVDGSYFELTMAPGEARQLTVEVGNFGTRDAVAMTYPADVYSRVNGGMGVRLAGEPTTGTTGWIGFEAETLPLAAGEGQLRTFAVSVPDDAAPGEYITSVVVQDATPAEETQTGGLAANRVNRQAIAVAITIPGPIAPALSLGAVEHHVAGGRSIITVEVANSGNVRLQPSGELVLSDAAGSELARFPVTMESVYAGTSTVAEIPFSTLLDPGQYIAALSLTDASYDVSVATQKMALTVPEIAGLASAPVLSPAQASIANQAPPSSGDDSTNLAVVAAVAVLTLILGGVIVSNGWLPQMTRRPVHSPAAAASTTVAGLMARPVTIRQLNVPRRHHDQLSPEPPSGESPRLRKLVVPAETAFNKHSKGA